MSHSPWPLFGTDLDQARQWLKSSWYCRPVFPQRLHWGLSLGLTKDVEQWLKANPSALSKGEQQKLNFRLQRLTQAESPHRAFLSQEQLAKGGLILNRASEVGGALRIRLNGGIGDHLQDIALISSWVAQQRITVILEADGARVNQFLRLTAELPRVQLQQASCRPAEHPLTSLAFEGYVRHSFPSTVYAAWLSQYRRPNTERGPRMICCWRSRGNADKLSNYCRSVGIAEVSAFYSSIQQQWPELCILDLTGWQPWEAAALRQHGIQFHDPSQGDLLALMRIVEGAEVVTIDTALAHLCACMHQSAWLLLPLFPDERWLTLRQQQHCYEQTLKVQQQTQFGRWNHELEQLAKKIRF